jgi:hypothetical protein
MRAARAPASGLFRFVHGVLDASIDNSCECPEIVTTGADRSALGMPERGCIVKLGGDAGGEMPKYRFSSLDGDGALQSSCIIEAASDDEARDIAEDLLMESHPAAVEVWDVFKLVHRAADANFA